MADRVLTPRAERIPINREYGSVQEFIHEYVSNISLTGAFIRSKDPLPVGTRVNLKFSIIADEIEIIEGIGEVVRVSTTPPGMGVVFRKLSEASQELIRRLCAEVPKHERKP